jgi:DNA polymerase-3 subunit delta
MPPRTLSALHQQIEAGSTGRLYLLVGDDAGEKAAVAAQFAEMIDEGLRPFNVDRLYGGDVKVDDVIRAAATLPMMAPRRVVMILEAEKLLVPKRESKAAEEEQERLAEFLTDSPAHATIVCVCGELDLRRRLIKLLLKQAEVVDCGTVTNAADADRWVRARARRDNVPLDAAVVRAIVERVGPDVVRLRAALERLVLYTAGESQITVDDVRQAVPPGPDTQENFAIANAIQSNDVARALRELKVSLDAGAPPYLILGQLRVAAEKLPASRLRQAVDEVFDSDLALKSSIGDPRIVLERLVVKLCARGRRA